MPTSSRPLRGLGPKVFISYSFKDLALAERLEEELLTRGHQVRREDETSLMDQKLSEAIKTRIGDSEVLIQLLTPAAKQSEWVRRELEMAREFRSEGRWISVLPLNFGSDQLPDEVADWWYLDVGSGELTGELIEQIHDFALRSIIQLPLAKDDPFTFDEAAKSAMLEAVATSRRRVLIDPDGQFLTWARDTEDFAKTLKPEVREGVIAQEARYAAKLPQHLLHADLVMARLARETVELVSQYASPQYRRPIELGVIDAFSEIVLGSLVLRASLISPPEPHILSGEYSSRIETARSHMHGDRHMGSPYLDEGYYRPIFERQLDDGTFGLGDINLYKMEMGGPNIRPIRALEPGVMFGSMEGAYTQYAMPFDPKGEILDGHFLKIILWQIAVYAYFNFPRDSGEDENIIDTVFGWSLKDYTSMGMA